VPFVAKQIADIKGLSASGGRGGATSHNFDQLFSGVF
jgi:hypothetical protein